MIKMTYSITIVWLLKRHVTLTLDTGVRVKASYCSLRHQLLPVTINDYNTMGRHRTCLAMFVVVVCGFRDYSLAY